jgi:hypothetical protein
MEVKITLVQPSKSLSFVSGLVIIADNGFALGEGGGIRSATLDCVSTPKI